MKHDPYTKREFELMDELSKLANARLKGNIEDGYTYGVVEYCRNDVEMTQKLYEKQFPFAIRKVIFNDPATIVYWSDGTKTVVKCQEGDWFDPEKGLAMAISKKALGNKGSFNNTFKQWAKEYKEPEPTIDSASDAMKRLNEAFKRFL